MRLGRRIVAGFLVFSALASVCRAASDPAVQLGFPPEVTGAMDGISPDRIRAHVQFLADDLLEGRARARAAAISRRATSRPNLRSTA